MKDSWKWTLVGVLTALLIALIPAKTAFAGPQAGKEPAKTEKTATVDTPPAPDKDLSLAMRNKQWDMAKAAIDLQNAQAEMKQKSQEVGQDQQQIAAIAEQILDKSKLDKSVWFFNQDTLAFEKKQPPTPAK